MDRRKALKIFGALFVCLAGHPVLANTNKDSLFLSDAVLGFEPTSYTFSEAGIKDIIIERKNGKRIVVPFSDIVDALET